MDKITIIKSLDENVIQFNELVKNLNKDEFDEYSEEVPFIKISDSYKIDAHDKNEYLLINYINEFIIKRGSCYALVSINKNEYRIDFIDKKQYQDIGKSEYNIDFN